MQIGSGQSPLSLAVLKTLGVQLPNAPQAPAAGSGVTASGTATSGATSSGPTSSGPGITAKTGSVAPANDPAVAAAEAGRDLGVAKTIPRGSFVDLKA